MHAFPRSRGRSRPWPDRAGRGLRGLLERPVLGLDAPAAVRPGAHVHAGRPGRPREELRAERRRAPGLHLEPRRLGRDLHHLRRAARPRHADAAERRAGPAAAGRLGALPLVGRAPDHDRRTRLRRARLGAVRRQARRIGRHAADGPRRRARRGRGRGRLPRVLVARRQAARLGAPQLELRHERRRRQVGHPRRRLRGRRREPAAPRERPRRAAGERPLLRDAVVGARRQRLPLHRVVGHGAQPRAVLLQAGGRRDALRGHAPDRQLRVGRAGDLHARHEERHLHVVARPPGHLQHVRAAVRRRRG